VTPTEAPSSFTGTALSAWADDPLLSTAAHQYSDWVQEQAALLVDSTGQLVDAVRAGDVERGRALYPVARAPWERLEPLGESSTDLDARIDGKESALAPGETLTGFHRIEQALWTDGDLAAAAPAADQLLADVQDFRAYTQNLPVDPILVAATAKSLLDESSTGKVTGDEEIWSHTELWDLEANLEGVAQSVAVLRPHLAVAAPRLLTQVDDRMARLQALLEDLRRGGGWTPSDQLSAAQLRALSDALTALTQPVSELEAAVVPR
jgi:iron uptake system component EfeO